MIDIQEMPHSEEAEKAVLGAIFCKPPAIAKVIDELTAMDFYRTRHQILYQGMADLYEKGDPIDLVTITSHLQEKKALDNAGVSPVHYGIGQLYTDSREHRLLCRDRFTTRLGAESLLKSTTKRTRTASTMKMSMKCLLSLKKTGSREIRERGKKRSVRPIRGSCVGSIRGELTERFSSAKDGWGSVRIS
ncbi:DnaB-like helicase N-terminal domain-containing protein [Brevibacillus brevis]|uniref:DnaB-like helicase N-terminal domain-containing protein n=1 Tax=Brevibacillus brevis TaxID=1393 RepID=UPI003D19E9F4